MNYPHLTQEKERLILDAAQSRFATFGFSKVTMDEIAEDIGMGKASLYYYYPTKEDIFREVIRREQGTFLRATAEILNQDSPAGDKLRAYVRRRIALGNELSNLSALSAKLWQDPKPVFRDLFAVFAAEEIKHLTRILSEGKATKEFDVAAPGPTAQMILHVLHGMRLRFLKSNHLADDNAMKFDEFATETDLFLETILQGLRNRNVHQKGT